MASLESVIDQVLVSAAKLKNAGAAGNEANTKALLIDPVLAALGWNLFDIEEVEREYRVFDNTALDYALRVEGKPHLFLEAKALNKSLAEKSFISQTVNYANNEGVLWCVLTNGLHYHVYKSNEPVPMDRKLLFEVDVADAATEEGRPSVLRSLRALGRDAVSSKELDRWGERVFTDVRIRAGLSRLAQDPTQKFIAAVSAAIEGPAMTPQQLKAGLARVLGSAGGSTTSGPLVGTATPHQPKPLPGGKPTVATVYDVKFHTEKRPAAIGDLFEQLNSLALGLGADVSRRVKKVYIGYFVGKKSFFTAELQKAKILVYISIPPAEAKPWDDGVMRDVTNIGHYGMGATEFTLTGQEQLLQLEPILRASYLRNRK